MANLQAFENAVRKQFEEDYGMLIYDNPKIGFLRLKDTGAYTDKGMRLMWQFYWLGALSGHNITLKGGY